MDKVKNEYLKMYTEEIPLMKETDLTDTPVQDAITGRQLTLLRKLVDALQMLHPYPETQAIRQSILQLIFNIIG